MGIRHYEKLFLMSEEEAKYNPESDESEMGFLEHLEELRWRIIKVVIGIVIAGIIIAVFIDQIINNVLLRPASMTEPPMFLINLKPIGQFTLYMEVIIYSAIILSMPNLVYQLWKFIEPALKPGERKYVWWVVFFTSICFLLGVAFAYFIMVPTSLGFFASFGTTLIENQIAIDEYLRFVVSISLASGIVFEMPMLTFFLSKIGILKPEFMRKYRKHAIVGIIIVGAILTPPDVISQLILAVPLIVLYEISILICKFAQKKTEIDNNLNTD